MTFVKGGILNSNQLESISNVKWKKGGILSAEQLNKLSASSGHRGIEHLNIRSRKKGGASNVIQFEMDQTLPSSTVFVISVADPIPSSITVTNFVILNPDYTLGSYVDKGRISTMGYSYTFDGNTLTVTCLNPTIPFYTDDSTDGILYDVNAFYISKLEK